MVHWLVMKLMKLGWGRLDIVTNQPEPLMEHCLRKGRLVDMGELETLP